MRDRRKKGELRNYIGKVYHYVFENSVYLKFAEKKFIEKRDIENLFSLYLKQNKLFNKYEIVEKLNERKETLIRNSLSFLRYIVKNTGKILSVEFEKKFFIEKKITHIDDYLLIELENQSIVEPDIIISERNKITFIELKYQFKENRNFKNKLIKQVYSYFEVGKMVYKKRNIELWVVDMKNGKILKIRRKENIVKKIVNYTKYQEDI